MNTQRPYANPYVVGCGLGLVLLAAFVLTGQGLGASGAFASVATAFATTFAPGESAANNYFARYAASGAPWTVWMVVEVVGIVIGGALSAALSGRLRMSINRGPNVGTRSRLVAAVTGGALMGLGAVLARGCTSGQALSGGAMLSVGSWIFMIAAFVGAFAVAPFARRLWR